MRPGAAVSAAGAVLTSLLDHFSALEHPRQQPALTASRMAASHNRTEHRRAGSLIYGPWTRNAHHARNSGPEIIMATKSNVSGGSDPVRHLYHALAALREAAECLEEMAATGERADGSVASARAHVAAARDALKPQIATDHGAFERQAA